MRDMRREGEIEAALAKSHPELVAPLRSARIAIDKGDYAAAEPLLRTIVTTVPDYDVGLRRLGTCLVQQGKRAEGLELCERAVTLNRSEENLTTLAYNLVAKQSSQDHRQDYARALQLLREARALPGGADLDTLALTAQVAISLDDRREFISACAQLQLKYPNEMSTHYVGAISAAMGQQWVRAEREIKQAEKLGLDHEAAQRFLASGIHSRALWSRIELDTGLTIGFWAAGLVLLFALGFLLSKLTLRQAGRADTLATVTAGERAVRKLYRVVLNVAGVYYYISLPIVLVLVVGVVAIALYAFLMIGQIPIKLMLILGIGAVVTIVAMIKSLFIRVQSSDPGRPLQRAEAPGLWELAEEVARAVGTRPIDEIRVTPGTELAVYERGTWREKLRNDARRVLLIGAGVLNGFKQNDFRCVLAHEYGHFSHRDTAGAILRCECAWTS